MGSFEDFQLPRTLFQPSLPSDSTTPPSLIPRAKRLIHLSIRGPREIQSASLFLFSLNTETLKRRFGREKATSKQARRRATPSPNLHFGGDICP